MLTKRVLFCYNKLLAVALIQLSLEDPLKELASRWWNPAHSDLVSRSLFVAAKSEINQDYYEILGVKRDADKHEIHKAFRQLAKKYHPDRNKEKGAQDEFIKIFQAYETLSDEKKRQEYDQQATQSSFGGANSAHQQWHHNQPMPNFDINEFFKQYEDQFLRHRTYHHQAHNSHHHQHNRFSFHGVDLDDLFHDIDEDEMQSFKVFNMNANQNAEDHLHTLMEDHFGDASTFFGTHLPSQIHDTINQYQHHHAHHHHNSDNGFRAQSCHTVTKQINGIIMTQTSCA